LQLGRSQGEIPRLQLLHFSGNIKGSKSILLPNDWLVLDIEPLLALVLERVLHPKIEVPSWALRRDDGSINIMDGGLRNVAPETEDAGPEPPMGVNTKKTFTQRVEARHVKDGVGV
jgi:hypothetical protein